MPSDPAGVWAVARLADTLSVTVNINVAPFTKGCFVEEPDPAPSHEERGLLTHLSGFRSVLEFMLALFSLHLYQQRSVSVAVAVIHLSFTLTPFC